MKAKVVQQQVSPQKSSEILLNLTSANNGANKVVKEIACLLDDGKKFSSAYAHLLLQQVIVCCVDTKSPEFKRLCEKVKIMLKKQAV